MKPVSEEDLLPALTLALTRFKQFQALHREVVDLREALEARKVIEKAKGILMRRLDLTEEEAFRRLQRQSQESNRKACPGGRGDCAGGSDAVNKVGAGVSSSRPQCWVWRSMFAQNMICVISCPPTSCKDTQA